jgi:purine-nucleoside phosphorylase
MMLDNYPYDAADKIKSAIDDFVPKVGIVLGSGLGSLAEKIENPIHIPYEHLPGFPSLTVRGHGGSLIIGTLNNTPVACLDGRCHSYEGDTSHDSVKTYIRTLKLLGCEYFIATNASGSLREDVGPGELMLITDHINFQPTNPLAGTNQDDFGPRFLPLDNAYDKDMRQKISDIAIKENITLNQGVYISVLGPSYESAAEIRAFRILGADAVGMSTVPEVIVANHCGLKVMVIATITNYATGLATSSHSHDAVVSMANKATVKLTHLITEFVGELE